MTEIIPAILARDEAELCAKLAALPREARAVHADFTPSSISPSVEGEYLSRAKGRGWVLFKHHHPAPTQGSEHPSSTEEEIFFEAHLMLPHPQEYISELVRAGFRRIVVQVENSSPEAFAELIHEWKHAVEIAPSLEIETPLDVIDSYAHELASMQLMGIAEIGAQGRPFDERVTSRVATLHAKYPHLTIAVDGGVNKKNAAALTEAGAIRFIVGSAIDEFYGR